MYILGVFALGGGFHTIHAMVNKVLTSYGCPGKVHPEIIWKVSAITWFGWVYGFVFPGLGSRSTQTSLPGIGNCSEHTDFTRWAFSTAGVFSVVAITFTSSSHLTKMSEQCSYALQQRTMATGHSSQISLGRKSHYKIDGSTIAIFSTCGRFCPAWIFQQLHVLPPWGQSLLIHPCP